MLIGIHFTFLVFRILLLHLIQTNQTNRKIFYSHIITIFLQVFLYYFRSVLCCSI